MHRTATRVAFLPDVGRPVAPVLQTMDVEIMVQMMFKRGSFRRSWKERLVVLTKSASSGLVLRYYDSGRSLKVVPHAPSTRWSQAAARRTPEATGPN